MLLNTHSTKYLVLMLISPLEKHRIVGYKSYVKNTRRTKYKIWMERGWRDRRRNLSFHIWVLNIFEIWPRAVNASIRRPIQDRGRYVVQRQLCPSKPLKLGGKLQKKRSFSVTRLKVDLYPSELGSLPSHYL